MTLTPTRKAEMVETLAAALRIVSAMQATTPCSECDNWQDNRCARWGAVPPDDVRAVGCDEFVESIPF